MRLLLAGNWVWQVYEQACADALSRLGIDIIRFAWNNYFRGLLGRLQSKFPFPGPAVFLLNRALVVTVRQANPDVVLIWRGTHILPNTIRSIRETSGAVVASYNNDDPFGPKIHNHAPWHHKLLWRNYLHCVPEYDINFVYRTVNIAETIQAGGKNAHLLKPYFIPAINRPVNLTELEKKSYGCDVVFVGHYEPDGREKYLRALVKAGLHVRLFGGKYWTRQILGDMADYFGEVHTLEPDEYTKSLCGAKMCLCFLSRINRDTYTRRCFEIPACGCLLLSERTADLERMFKENEEAVFFSSPDELVEKALWLKNHPVEIQRIASAGMRRVHADRHSVEDRMRQFLDIINICGHR